MNSREPANTGSGGVLDQPHLEQRSRVYSLPVHAGQQGGEPPTFIIGRAEIAHRLGRSERTVSRWIARGILKATKAGPFSNNLLKVSAADLERLA